MFDQKIYDLLDEAQQQAEESQSRPQYGKCTVDTRFMTWSDGQPTDVTPEEYAAAPKDRKSTELIFSIDIREFNPDLTFTYERKVNIKKADWHKIVFPSLKKATGESDLSKIVAKLNGTYVEANDVLQAATKKRPNPEYRTVQFVRTYASREECYAAYAERFNKDVSAPAATNVPEPYTAEQWEAVKSEYDKVVAQCAGLPEAAQNAMLEKVAADLSIDPKWAKANANI